MSKNDTAKNQYSLYSQEELTSMEPDNLFNQPEGPITCLGLEFPDEEARREYFREELRKRLPELRKIEGFPIGTDDDIIRQSDPPYYTACPNPWLNDFIAKWEKEKLELVKKGKRDPNKIVTEPYSYGIEHGKNSAIYNAHTYHTKVPYEIIMRYVLHYTQPGDIIYDGFAGTGMTGVAASMCKNPDPVLKRQICDDLKKVGTDNPVWGKRNCICSDLSPLCYHISSSYNKKTDIAQLKNTIEEILSLLHSRFDSLYTIKMSNGVNAHVNYYVWSEIVSCKNCGSELNVHDLSFNYENNTLNKKIKCPICGVEQKETETTKLFVSVYDAITGKVRTIKKYEQCKANCSTTGARFFVNTKEISKLPDFEGFVPLMEFPSNAVVYRSFEGCNIISDIYPTRTRYVLGYLYKLITEGYLKYQKELLFVFTSMLPKLTIMNRYMPQHGSRALVGPMANVLYIPPQYVENNPIDQFEYQAKKVLKAYSESDCESVVHICSATDLDIADNSIDYIFTDPPFGSNIMYSELNVISESWLRLLTNKEQEAISNRSQNKGLYEYQNIITKCFKEYYRILKPNRFMTVEFSNTSAAFWNCLQNSIQNAGFVLSCVTDLNKERGGLFSMITSISVKQDLAITCYKPSEKVLSIMQDNCQNSAWTFIEEHLSHLPTSREKGNKLLSIAERDQRILYDRLISYYVKHGLPVPMDAREFQRGLKEHFVERDGMYFTAAQAIEYEEKRRHSEGFAPMGIIVSDEANGIEWLNIFLRESPKTYQEIQPEWMQAINGLRRGDILPELKTILEENFIEMEDGRWRLPNIQDDVDKNLLRTKALLREFSLYKELAMKPKAKLKEVRVEALRAGFKQCYIDKDFATIVHVSERIPQNLLEEDEVLLQFYDIALNKL